MSISYCEDELGKIGFRINTVIGRYYAMDRDRRWDRTKLGWDAIVHGHGEYNEVLPSEAVKNQYENNKTDEFLPVNIQRIIKLGLWMEMSLCGLTLELTEQGSYQRLFF